MKAVVVEIKGRYVAVLREDGVVLKERNRNYSIGQEIRLGKNNKLIKVLAGVAAVMMIFVTPAWAYLTPYSYVSLDVNPSFEFSINRFDRVLTVEATNDDGEEFAKDIDIRGLKNKEIQNAIKDVIKELKIRGYIGEGQKNNVILATSSKTQDKTDKLAKTLRAVVNDEVSKEQVVKEMESPDLSPASEETVAQEAENTYNEAEINEKPKIEEKEKSEKSENSEKTESVESDESVYGKGQKSKTVKVIEVTKKKIDEAKSLGVTPGKLNLVERLKKAADLVGVEIDSDDWLDSSVKDITAKINEYYEKARQEERTYEYEYKDNDKDKDKDKDDDQDDVKDKREERDSRDKKDKREKEEDKRKKEENKREKEDKREKDKRDRGDNKNPKNNNKKSGKKE